jgi:hypothetical protein
MFFWKRKEKKTRFGVSYNLFDGEELLESSIKSIRKNIDFISVVYQTVSNYGNPCSENLVPTLEKLKNNHLIDELVHYTPHSNTEAHFNEIEKRNIGLTLSRKAGCDYHMSMDADEYYIEEQLEFAKSELLKGKFDASVCQMRTYYKSPFYQLSPPEDYYVSLFYKIKKGRKYEVTQKFPVLVDPTRKMKTKNCRIFSRSEIEMHHMSYVRKEIRKKLTNSSALINYKEEVNRIVEHFENWNFPEPALLAGLPPKLHQIIQVENKFGELF